MSDLPPSAAAPPKPDDDTTVEFLAEIIGYFERMKHRAGVCWGDATAMQMAKEAIDLCTEALEDAKRRREQPQGAPAAMPSTLYGIYIDAWQNEVDTGRRPTAHLAGLRAVWVASNEGGGSPDELGEESMIGKHRLVRVGGYDPGPHVSAAAVTAPPPPSVATSRERAAALPSDLTEARRIVDDQACDDGLWFDAFTITEVHLQRELRRLHVAVERATGGETGPLAARQQEERTHRVNPHENISVDIGDDD